MRLLNETARVHRDARRCGGVADCGEGKGALSVTASFGEAGPPPELAPSSLLSRISRRGGGGFHPLLTLVNFEQMCFPILPHGWRSGV
jgi:hypothetical protein